MASAPLSVPLSSDEIDDARTRIADIAVRTPLVRTDDGAAWVKLECLQPYGSYKIRGAANALRACIEGGVELKSIVTASAGNFGQAIAAVAAQLGLPVVIHVPDKAARVKVENLKRLGAEVHVHAFDDWWRIMESRQTGESGTFFHPVCERQVIAGAATIGEEILEDLPRSTRCWSRSAAAGSHQA